MADRARRDAWVALSTMAVFVVALQATLIVLAATGRLGWTGVLPLLPALVGGPIGGLVGRRLAVRRAARHHNTPSSSGEQGEPGPSG